jgi:hypothetical protein
MVLTAVPRGFNKHPKDHQSLALAPYFVGHTERHKSLKAPDEPKTLLRDYERERVRDEAFCVGCGLCPGSPRFGVACLGVGVRGTPSPSRQRNTLCVARAMGNVTRWARGQWWRRGPPQDVPSLASCTCAAHTGPQQIYTQPVCCTDSRKIRGCLAAVSRCVSRCLALSRAVSRLTPQRETAVSRMSRAVSQL